MRLRFPALVLILSVLAILATPFPGQLGEAKEDPGLSSRRRPPRLKSAQAADRFKESGKYSSLAEAVEAAQYSIYPAAGTASADNPVLEAHNPANSFTGRFSESGLELSPLSGEAAWRLNVSFAGFGRGNGIQRLSRGKSRVLEGRKSVITDYLSDSGQAVTEWFINKKEGLEQGWTITERPDGDEGRLGIVLETDGELLPASKGDRQAIDFVNRNGDRFLKYDRLKSWDSAGRLLPTRIDSDGRRVVISVDDSDAVYPVTVDPFFSETIKLSQSDAQPDDYFGFTVSVSGDTAVVGMLPIRPIPGFAFVFSRNNGGSGAWGEVTKITSPDGAAGDEFGSAVAISDDTVIIGAPIAGDGGSSTGLAYLFGRNRGGADNWGLISKLHASDAAAGNEFGYSVSINGDTAVVGSIGDAGNTGSAYIFSRNAGGPEVWGQVRKLQASDAQFDDGFGFAVSIYGDRAAVGAPGNDDLGSDSGSVYVFGRNQGGPDNWGEITKRVASDGNASDFFGESVSIGPEILAVGASGNDESGSNSGSAYVFERSTGGADNWGEVKKLVPDDSAAAAVFGFVVSVDGDRVAVGSPGHAGNGPNSGAAYVFLRNLGGADEWGQKQMLTASDGQANEAFGYSLSLNGDSIVVGAVDLDGSSSGSAYVFEDQQDIWEEAGKTFAGDAAAGDSLGTSVSIHGTYAVAGAPQKDGVGAVYVFKRNTSGSDVWGEIAKLSDPTPTAGGQFGSSVAIFGDKILVGAPQDGGTGSAFVFSLDGSAPVVLTASDAATGDSFGKSVALNSGFAVVGAPGEGSSTGAAYVFGRNSNGAGGSSPDGWGQVKKLIADDGAVGDEFGFSVGLAIDTAIVGARFDDDLGISSGSAYLFERNTTDRGEPSPDEWGQAAKLTAGDGAADDEFGFSVSIYGDIAVVGSPADDDGGSASGSAYLFYRNNGGADSWGQQVKILASEADPGDRFGSSVAVYGSAAAVGAPNDDGARGAVYMFRKNSGGSDAWGELDKLAPDDGAMGDQFGASVSLHVDSLLVGAPFGEALSSLSGGRSSSGKGSLGSLDEGAAYVYKMGLSVTAGGTLLAGRVTDGMRPLVNVAIVLTSRGGNQKVVRTNHLGQFRFEDIEAGQTMLLSAYAKGYTFQPLVVNLNFDLTGIEIVGQ
ncbi:MAG: FG-GAP repeat protein [Acidobacteriota bacterium]|nr:MAG: FG-GAP repeat protein [Acidobacteriota bacterium]